MAALWFLSYRISTPTMCTTSLTIPNRYSSSPAMPFGSIWRKSGLFSLNDFRCLYQRDGETIQRFLKHLDEKMEETYPNGFTKENVTYTDLSNDKVMLLNYTSGTTGFSKGVMLTGNNLAGNVTYAKTLDLMYRGDRELCFLPLAHAYSCAFNFLVPMAVGAHVYMFRLSDRYCRGHSRYTVRENSFSQNPDEGV